ncbi:MAG TPA: DUF2442 domain-containing protein [Anaerolineales bacterium]|nr:DUF2442 domain-containing protein [Anaerolineales bacterium]
MVTETKQTNEKMKVKRYKIQHSIDEYTFPKEAYIHAIKFDDKHMHVELTDGRIISIPLWWIPSVYNASDEDRNKFEINQSRTMIIWNPEKCGINDEINIRDYLGPTRNQNDQNSMVYASQEARKQISEGKSKTKKK